LSAYIYSRASPLVYFDPDGREVVYEDFPSDKQDDAEAAVEEVKRRLGDNPCCVEDGRAEEILDLLNDPNETVKIKYRGDAKHCGFTPLSSLMGFNNTIRIGPSAWNCCPTGGPRGITSLASTILHELHHYRFRTPEGPAYEAEKQCFGC
jgi:hypothetical protein